MPAKQRLSVTIDPDVLDALQQAVDDGRAANTSALVNAALRQYLGHEARLAAFDEFRKAWEAEYGVMTDEEMEARVRDLRSRAIVVRGRKKA